MEVVKKALETVDPVNKRIIVEVPMEDFNQVFEEVLQVFARSAKVDGFRPGKAPVPLVRRKYESEIREKAADEIISRTIFEILEEYDLPAVEAPVIEAVEEKDGRFRYTAIVEVKPEFEVRGYTGLKLKKTKREVKDEDVEKVIEDVRNQLAELVPQERPARENDVVELGYTGYEGEEEKDKVERTVIELGKGQFLEDFEKHIIGMKPGEEKEVDITFPSDHPKPQLAGKTFRYHIRIMRVFEKKLPELNDELAQKIAKVETLDEWKKQIREQLEKRIEKMTRESLIQQVLERLSSEHKDVPIPPTLLRRRFNALLDEAMRGFYLSRITEETARKLLDVAKEHVKRDLILERIAEQEGLNVTTKDVLNYTRTRFPDLSGLSDEDLENFLWERDLFPEIEELLKRQRALDFVLDKAQIKEEG